MLVPGRATVVGDEALVGNVVAERYVVEDIIGHGSTGTVFTIHHVAYPRAFIMKVLRPSYATNDLISRVFHGEVRSTLGVSHPGLCEVFDIGTLPDGAPFLVMEYLQGETLASRISRERISIGFAVDIALQLLAAVSAIHQRALMVRELRPENVFLTKRRGCRPVLKILDLGLARLTPFDRLKEEWERSQATGASAAGLTRIPLYLSPERTRSENDVLPASDLYSVGVLLYEALTSDVPFMSASFRDLVAAIANGTRPRASERRAEIPTELDVFLERALAADPRDRFESANEMQDDLRAVFEDKRIVPTEHDDEASADNVERTIPPQRLPEPAPWSNVPDTQDTFDDSIEQAFLKIESEEEDTETMTLSPALKAKIEEIMSPSTRPPTKRTRK